MRRQGAVLASVVAGVAAALCFTHQPSVSVDGKDTQCRGPHIFYAAAAEADLGDEQWRPAGCEAEYHRWLAYSGGLGLLSLVAGTGAAFYRRESESLSESTARSARR